MNALSPEDQASLVLLAPWSRRQELLLLSARSGELVPGLPVEEFFWTVKAVGPRDALPLLRLAAPAQLQFIFDLDWWHKDTLRPEKVAAWLILLLEAGEDAAAAWLRWIAARDLELLAALFRLFARVERRPDDMDFMEARDRLPPFTLDDLYFVAFHRQEWQPLLARYLDLLLQFDPPAYRAVMEELVSGLPTENLEAAYRWRAARLVDFGVPEHGEALDIYARLSPARVHRLTALEARAAASGTPAVPSFVPTLYLGPMEAVRRAVEGIAGTPAMERVLHEWVWAANKLLVVDDVDLDDPAALEEALRRVTAHVNLGLEILSEAWGQAPPEVLASATVEDVIRVALTRVREAVAGVRRLHQAGVFPEGLRLLEDDLAQAVSGLFRTPPLYYDAGAGTHRPFQDLAEVSAAARASDRAAAWFGLAEVLSPHWRRWPEVLPAAGVNLAGLRELTWPRGLLTALAVLELEGIAEVRPVPEERLAELRRAWFESAPAGPVRLRPGLAADLAGRFRVAAGGAVPEGIPLPEMVAEAMGRLASDWEGLAWETAPDGRFVTALLVGLEAD